MQRTCCGNDHCGCQRCGRVLQVGSKPAPPFRHTGRDATIWWHGKLTPILHDMPVERCCSTSSGAASTTATHTACDHHCCGSAPSPAAAAIRKFRPGTTTRGHHSRAASISPLREENDLHGSICEIIGPRAVCDRTNNQPAHGPHRACAQLSSVPTHTLASSKASSAVSPLPPLLASNTSK